MLNKLTTFPDNIKYLKRVVANNHILETLTYGQDSSIITTLAMHYYQSEQYKEAVIQFKRVMDHKSLDGDKHRYVLSICYIQLDKYDEAAEILIDLYRKPTYEIEPLLTWMDRGTLSFRECIYEDLSHIAIHYKKIATKSIEGGDSWQLLAKDNGTHIIVYYYQCYTYTLFIRLCVQKKLVATISMRWTTYAKPLSFSPTTLKSTNS